jgi:hypothetical protein
MALYFKLTRLDSRGIARVRVDSIRGKDNIVRFKCWDGGLSRDTAAEEPSDRSACIVLRSQKDNLDKA